MTVTKEDWKATTLGGFICYLVDNQDPAVIWRTTNETDVGDGKFIEHIELDLVPNGSVVDALEGAAAIDKTLGALIKAGLVK